MIEIPLNQLHTAIYIGLMFIYIRDKHADIEYYHEDGCSYGQAIGDTYKELESEIEDNIRFIVERYPNIKLIMKFYSAEVILNGS